MSRFIEITPLAQEMEWTNAQVIKMMQEYKNRPILWDPHHDMYRVQSAKYEAWSQMAQIFQCDVVDLRKKFNSIFASHRREKMKVRHGTRTSWFLYDYMSFLPTHLENVPGSAQPATDKLAGVSDSSHGNSEHEIIIKEEPLELSLEKAQKLHTKPRLKRVIKRTQLAPKRLVRRVPVHDVSSVFKCVTPSGGSKLKDECDSFGEYIAVSLRKHDERSRSMIKQAINNIMFEQEMKKYNNSYTVVMTEVENPLDIEETENCDEAN
ncbi:unnamed protein product [Leptidea sinapis]|uniref:MADF domain-containing protein n=1 Tax=Leptidea sinapis TaxID=189913 RepID=A0A5E4QE56_9NEOP|nr:unnamed protein product [Leptidea sinapis]